MSVDLEHLWCTCDRGRRIMLIGQKDCLEALSDTCILALPISVGVMPHFKHKESGFFPCTAYLFVAEFQGKSTVFPYPLRMWQARADWSLYALCCPRSQAGGSAAVLPFRLWTEQIVNDSNALISRCWLSPFHFPGWRKRLIYSYHWGGRGLKQMLIK